MIYFITPTIYAGNDLDPWVSIRISSYLQNDVVRIFLDLGLTKKNVCILFGIYPPFFMQRYGMHVDVHYMLGLNSIV